MWKMEWKCKNAEYQAPIIGQVNNLSTPIDGDPSSRDYDWWYEWYFSNVHLLMATLGNHWCQQASFSRENCINIYVWTTAVDQPTMALLRRHLCFHLDLDSCRYKDFKSFRLKEYFCSIRISLHNPWVAVWASPAVIFLPFSSAWLLGLMLEAC